MEHFKEDNTRTPVPLGGPLSKEESFGKMLRSAQRIVTLSHTLPDGDAIGSSFAAFSYIQDVLGKSCTCIFPNRIAPTLDFMHEGEKYFTWDINEGRCRKEIERADLVLCLDFNVFSRLGADLSSAVLERDCPRVLVDHHVGPDTAPFDLVFSDTSVSSTCELLYWILLRTPDIAGDPHRLPARCRWNLMAGMTTDTNNFSNSTTPSTFRMASDLLECGVDRDGILVCVNQSYRLQRLRLMGHILEDLLHVVHLPCGWDASYFILSAQTLSKFGILKGETEGFVNLPLTVGDIRLSVSAREDRDSGNFRISTRSKSGVSARDLCREHFNGGGHELAAGGTLYMGEENAKKEGGGIFLSSPDEIGPYIEKAILGQFSSEGTEKDDSKS